ncbi:putative 2OG-Fe(II) oxygenase [Alkalimonas amylolytica]|uniref:Tetratricopeptide repeat-containing protein n=1 Tax=Alkalimonas amylolytica TaxID=152573 RepID=A0A1H4F8I1_ALKAM|nr:putative 2OG-Fe(II) oxygenase [Alkalimonas amylolytica]SEA93501.1 Tetratricopeptide repeat-containing protein [Alkalimonas amylolytica]
MSELSALTQQAKQLKQQQRYEEAIALYKQACLLSPQDPIPEHNLATAYADADLLHDARYHARMALQLGSKHAATWLVLARAEQGLHHLAEAEQAYRQALAIDPVLAEAHLELAQLLWMQSANIQQTVATLIAAIKQHPDNPVLRLTLARVFEGAGDIAVGYKVLADTLLFMEDEVLLSTATHLALDHGDHEQALVHAKRAYAMAPQYAPALMAYCYALMANEQAAQALPMIDGYVQQQPDDQLALAVQATALRLSADERYQDLCNYKSMVQSYALQTPQGWSSMSDYLAELKQAVRQHHHFQTHPFGQSVRHGSQQPSLLRFKDPAIQAFPQAIAPAIEQYLQHIGADKQHPLSRRNQQDWQFNGIWSVLLKSQGFHSNHVHSKGWISSACYLELPKTVKQGSVDGWLKFGEPGLATQPKLAVERYVKPEVGQLVLFPSYFWHGTVPFSGSDSRMTIAFDLVPKA